MDWIQGNKFQEMATFTYCPANRHQDDYYGFPSTLQVDRLKDNDTIFTHPFYVSELFDIIRSLNVRVIVITHNGDNRIDSDGVVSLDGRGNVIKVEPYFLPDNLIMWYAQNVNTIDSRIESIPIGLENNIWQPHENKKEKMIVKLKEPRRYKNLVYMNHNIATNPAKREEPYKLLKDKEWVTCEMGSNGHGFDEYLDNIYNHKFVVCPEGNGVDTHRVWECLYMGSIPIVEDNISAELLYSYFPCLIAHEGWMSLDDISLKWEFKVITDIKGGTDIHNEMLTFGYWKNKINNVNV